MYHILVIEDEPALSEMIQLNLELEGYNVVTCNNGRLALTFAEKLAQFQLVVLDVMLPEVSGLDICRAFRQQSDIPILFLSAKGTTVDRIAGLKLGANDYLPKPFDLEELLLRVQILATLWGNDQYPTGRTIDNYILNFRKLFEKDPKNPLYFHSIHGVGYKFTLPE